MNAKLLVVIGKTTKRKVNLQLPAVLGRSREADVTVAHPLVSRRHCEISEDGGLLMLRDLASLNGTLIGGRRIELAPLLPDAEFTIGPFTFRVLYEYEGNIESIPDTRFLDEVPGSAQADFGRPASAGEGEVPMFDVDALPAPSASESSAGGFAMPDFLALADADPEDLHPSAPPTRTPPVVPSGSRWPPVANDKLPTVPMEPLEDDSSLQSGGYSKTPSRAAEPWTTEEPRHAPRASGKGPPDATSVAEDDEIAKPPTRKIPPQ